MDDKKRFECPDGFAVESTDEDEVIKMAKEHIKEKDNMDTSDDEVKEHIRTL